MIWMIIYLLFMSSYHSKSDIFEVKNVKESFQILQQLNCSQKMQDRLSTWGELVKNNSLMFEDPVTNFLFISTLIEITEKENIGPAVLKKSFKRTVTIPSRRNLRKSAALLHEMISMYNIPLEQEIFIMTF